MLQDVTRGNHSREVEFLIVGFSDFPHLWFPLYLSFLLVYILTLVGNLVLIIVIALSPKLKTPMYFFLCNLSSLDIVYTLVTAPRLIHIFAVNNHKISFRQCITQLYFFIAFGSTEYLLLTLMSYDRYVAVCKPLHYRVVMSPVVCRVGAAGAWVGGLLASIPTATSAANIYYCGNNIIINHFFCDMMALVKLACSDTTITRAVIFVEGMLMLMTCFLLTVISYICILSTIVRIHSSEGKFKAFSTCASHLFIVSIFYVIIFYLYLKPKSEISLSQGKVLTALYVYFIPMFNPIVYSFRNKDVQKALTKYIISQGQKLFAGENKGH